MFNWFKKKESSSNFLSIVWLEAKTLEEKEKCKKASDDFNRRLKEDIEHAFCTLKSFKKQK